MTCPVDEITVCGINVHLQADKELLENEEVFGDCDNSTNILRYCDDDSISPSQQKVTVLHEVIHYIKSCLGHDDHEHETQGMAHAIYVLLKQNPDFAKWLSK